MGDFVPVAPVGWVRDPKILTRSLVSLVNEVPQPLVVEARATDESIKNDIDFIWLQRFFLFLAIRLSLFLQPNPRLRGL